MQRIQIYLELFASGYILRSEVNTCRKYFAQKRLLRKNNTFLFAHYNELHCDGIFVKENACNKLHFKYNKKKMLLCTDVEKWSVSDFNIIKATEI